MNDDASGKLSGVLLEPKILVASNEKVANELAVKEVIALLPTYDPENHEIVVVPFGVDE